MVWQNFKDLKVSLLILCIIAICILSIVRMPTNCHDDVDCFQEKAIKCSPAKLTTDAGGNIYQYRIKAEKDDKCVITTTMLKASAQTPKTTRNILEGKGMVCELPQDVLENQDINEVPALMNYCTGPLKEALQAITIENMYEQVVKNLSDIIRDARGGFVF